MPYITTDTLIRRSFHIIYLCSFLIVIISTLLGGDFTEFMGSESSPVEILSVVGYILATAGALYSHYKGYISYGINAAIILFVMALRELDFHDRFTTMGIMKTRFYISDAVPVTEKIIAAVITLIVLYVIIRFFWRNTRPFIQAVQAKNGPALLTLNGLAFTVASKLIDSNNTLFLGVLEETLEFSIPFFFLLAILFHDRERLLE